MPPTAAAIPNEKRNLVVEWKVVWAELGKREMPPVFWSPVSLPAAPLVAIAFTAEEVNVDNSRLAPAFLQTSSTASSAFSTSPSGHVTKAEQSCNVWPIKLSEQRQLTGSVALTHLIIDATGMGIYCM